MDKTKSKQLKKTINTHDHWISESGEHSEVVMSTRVRLARNLQCVKFPQWASEEQLTEICRYVKEAAPNGSDGIAFYDMSSLTMTEKQLLVEEHIISPQFATQNNGYCLGLSDDKKLSIMVNEEDHIRIQSISAGLDLTNSYKKAVKVDSALETRLHYAFSEKWGYLTACPTNIGTAMRASLMLHLPALVMTQQIQPFFQAVSQTGIVIRGLFGERTHAVGNVYQISNSTTLGRSDSEIIDHIKTIGLQIANKERTARKMMYSQAKEKLVDRSSRALGILKYAKLIAFEEAMELLSMLKLGLDMELFKDKKIDRAKINDLIINIRPAHLELLQKRELDPKQELMVRAELISEAMS